MPYINCIIPRLYTYSAINCEDKVQLSKCSAVRRNQTTALILSLYFWRIQSKEEDRTTALIGKQRSCDFGARRVNMIRPSCCEEGKHDPSWKKSTWSNQGGETWLVNLNAYVLMSRVNMIRQKVQLWQQVSNELKWWKMNYDRSWQLSRFFPIPTSEVACVILKCTLVNMYFPSWLRPLQQCATWRIPTLSFCTYVV